jgi:nucleotide-binding universal stress UspA family protein
LKTESNAPEEASIVQAANKLSAIAIVITSRGRLGLTTPDRLCRLVLFLDIESLLRRQRHT